MVASNQRGRHQGEQLVAVLNHTKIQLADVRFGSKADMATSQRNVRFTPKSGHWLSVSGCPLCAKSGHSALQ
jgi:hypothetical protein